MEQGQAKKGTKIYIIVGVIVVVVVIAAIAVMAYKNNKLLTKSDASATDKAGTPAK